MLLRQIFDLKLAQYSYLIGCPPSGEALLVDPLRDVDRYLDMADAEGLQIVAVAETHIHADFLSGARELGRREGIRVYLSDECGAQWRYGWADEDAHLDHRHEIILLHDGDTFSVGSIDLRALHTPGHTPEHLCYLVTDRGGGASTPIGLFTGDFVLVGDLGRPDLLAKVDGAEGSGDGSARALYRSLAIITELDEHLQLWPAHGAGSSCGKSIGAVPTSTVGYEKRFNGALLRAAAGETAFIEAILAEQPTPPTYFGRMKRENRDGPPLLLRLPRPRSLGSGELTQIVSHGETVIVDARLKRSDFMEGHLPGSIYAPFDRSFSITVGSLLAESTRPIVLLVEVGSVEEAIRDLVRIGYDLVIGCLPPATLEEYRDSGGEMAAIQEIDFDAVAGLRAAGDHLVIDVRDYFEFAEGHIPGAVSAPHVRLPEYATTRIPQGQPLIVHCESGARSAVASAWLASQGRDVLYVNDHWSNWTVRGGEVEGAEAATGLKEDHRGDDDAR